MSPANGVTLGEVPSGFDLADNAKAVFEVPLTAAPWVSRPSTSP